MEHEKLTETFAAARFIKDIGRGKEGARSLVRHDARDLFAAMLDGRVSDLELGAILIAMRIKGESVEEIAGFMEATEATFGNLIAPANLHLSACAPIVIPSYNGSRRMANLTPLLAMLLAREGVAVLVHGLISDPGRVTSAEIFQAMGVIPAASILGAEEDLAAKKLCFLPLATLAPGLSRLLGLRRVLGVRNSTHTLVKIIQPFAGPALRLASYTHPEYLELLGSYFSKAAPPARGDAFLMRGTEGEAVANARRAQQIDWFHEGERTVLVEKQDAVDDIPVMPADSGAETTARWIESVLRGEQPIPKPIIQQTERCLQVSRLVHARVAQNEPLIS